MNSLAESINVMWVVCVGVHKLQVKQGVQCKYNLFQPNLDFFRQIFMEVPLSNFTEISPMVAAVVRAD